MSFRSRDPVRSAYPRDRHRGAHLLAWVLVIALGAYPRLVPVVCGIPTLPLMTWTAHLLGERPVTLTATFQLAVYAGIHPVPILLSFAILAMTGVVQGVKQGHG